MRAILFVDDEPFILEGLRSLLRKQRESWNMSFVSSGPAALEALAQQGRDVSKPCAWHAKKPSI